LLALLASFSVYKGFAAQQERHYLIPPCDYYLFWGVANAVSSGSLINIYSDEGALNVKKIMADHAIRSDSVKEKNASKITEGNLTLRPTASPLLYALVGYLSIYDFDEDVFVYSIIMLTCYVTSILLLSTMLKLPLHWMILSILYLTALYNPYQLDMTSSNFNQLQLLIISLLIYALVYNKTYLSGFLIVLEVLLKLNTAELSLMAMLLVIFRYNSKQIFKVCVGSLCAIVFSFAICSIYFNDFLIWSKFFASIPKTLAIMLKEFESGNYGLVSLVDYTTGINIVWYLKVLLYLPLLSIVVSWIASRKKAGAICGQNRISVTRHYAVSHNVVVEEVFIVVAVGTSIMLLSSELVWMHYFLLNVPLLLLMGKYVGSMDISVSGKIAIILALILSNSYFMTYYASQISCSIALNLSTAVMLAVCYSKWISILKKCDILGDPQKRGVLNEC
jgi:hypothetical protein